MNSHLVGLTATCPPAGTRNAMRPRRWTPGISPARRDLNRRSSAPVTRHRPQRPGANEFASGGPDGQVSACADTGNNASTQVDARRFARETRFQSPLVILCRSRDTGHSAQGRMNSRLGAWGPCVRLRGHQRLPVSGKTAPLTRHLAICPRLLFPNPESGHLRHDVLFDA